MNDSRIAQRYAGALFAAAVKTKAVESIADDLRVISHLIEVNPRFRTFLLSPETPRDQKVAIADSVLGDRVTATTLHFLKLLLEKRRESEIETIHLEFDRLFRNHQKTILVRIESAFPLSEREQGLLIEKARKITECEVIAEFEVDSTLIGGVRLSYENIVLDGSLRGNLDKLRDNLAQDLTNQT